MYIESVPNKTLKISSPAFADGDQIPVKYSCEGEDVNPPLVFEGTPELAKSLVLIVEDPDAVIGTWDHWILFNIPPDTNGIEEAVEHPPGVGGQNSWGNSGYGGPCPGRGTHRYIFRLYALDILVPSSASAQKSDIIEAMRMHVLDEAVLIGTFAKIHADQSESRS